jgi:hypothetical protein
MALEIETARSVIGDSASVGVFAASSQLFSLEVTLDIAAAEVSAGGRQSGARLSAGADEGWSASAMKSISVDEAGRLNTRKVVFTTTTILGATGGNIHEGNPEIAQASG